MTNYRSILLLYVIFFILFVNLFINSVADNFSNNGLPTMINESPGKNFSEVSTSQIDVNELPLEVNAYKIKEWNDTYNRKAQEKTNIDSLRKQNTEGQHTSGPSVCKTNKCKTESGILISNVDYSSDYCNNFFAYACGGFRQNRRLVEVDPKDLVLDFIKDGLNEINKQSSASEKKLKEFYDSCINYRKVKDSEREDTGKKLLKELNLKYSPENESFNFTQMIITLIQLDSFPIFDVGFDVDSSNTSQLALKLTLNLEDYLFDTEKEKENECKRSFRNEKFVPEMYRKFKKCMNDFSDYRDTIREALSKFKVFGDATESNNQIRKIDSDVKETLMKIYDVIIYRVEEYEVQVFTVKDIQKKFNQVEWKLLFSVLLNRTISDDTRVLVHYFEDLEYIFENIITNEKKLRKLHNALLAHFTQNIYKYFVKNPVNSSSREKYCLEIISRLIPDVTSNLFMGKFDAETLENQFHEVIKIAKLVRDTLLDEIRKVSSGWLQGDSAEAVQNKTNSLRIVTVPKLLEFDPEINFENVAITKNYLLDSAELIKRKQRLLYSLYDVETSSSKVVWMVFLRTYSSESVYIHGINTLAIPEIVLWEHEKELPDAITMARLGQIIARGFAGAFDNKGIKISYENKYKKILTQTSYTTFELSLLEVQNNDECFKGCEYTEDGKSYMLKSSDFIKKIINEKVTDVTATKLAIETLRKYGRNDSEVLVWGDFTSEQLYFLTLAQTFCTKKTITDVLPDLYRGKSAPAFLRIRNIISTSEEFFSAFQCTSKKAKVIKVFPYLNKHNDGTIL